MRVWLDDQVEPSRWAIDGSPVRWDAWFYNAESLVKIVKLNLVSFIHFDHDLAGPMTGYDLAKEIERLAYEGEIAPIGYGIHSGNSVGAANIDKAMKAACRFWERLGKESRDE